MNSTYNQLVKNLEYLKMKQMITHLNEVIDFSNGAKVVQFGKSKFIKVK